MRRGTRGEPPSVLHGVSVVALDDGPTLAADVAADDVVVAHGVAALCSGTVAEAAQVAGDHVGLDLSGVGIGERVVVHRHAAGHMVSEQPEPAALYQTHRDIAADRVVLERRECRAAEQHRVAVDSAPPPLMRTRPSMRLLWKIIASGAAAITLPWTRSCVVTLHPAAGEQ